MTHAKNSGRNPLVEEQLHEHANGEAHRVLVVTFQPRSRLSQGGIRVRGEPTTGQLVAGGPVVDEGEEALDLADELIEVALLGDDERVQLILLEGAVRQRRQKLPRIFPPGEPFRELPAARACARPRWWPRRCSG